MKYFISKSKALGDKTAFKILKEQIVKKPDSLIGFAVGKTTDGLHKLIISDVKKNPSIWKKIKVFQIDENLGLGPEHPLSFNFEIRSELNLLFKILKKENIFLIDGTENPKSTIKKAYEFIKKNKGIDLITLGLGPECDPHIAYNTTGKSSLNSKMRVVFLHPEVAKKIVKGLRGITLGIKDILECKKAILIAYGLEKANSIELTFKKVNLKKASASALLLHKNLFVIVDKEAGSFVVK